MTPPRLSDAELVDAYAPLTVDRDTADFYRGWLAHELRVNRCTACGHRFLPPRPLCPKCWSWSIDTEPVSGRGTIFLLFLLHQGPQAPGVDYTSGPYPVATVELQEQAGLRFTSTVVDAHANSLMVGQPVELAWIERNGVPFPAFRPVESLRDGAR